MVTLKEYLESKKQELEKYQGTDREFDILDEILEAVRDFFEDVYGYDVYSWDAYGDKELRYYVLEIEYPFIVKFIIYPYRAEIREDNRPISEVDPYFYKEIFRGKV